MPSTPNPEPLFFDAGMFIGALLDGDPRHSEARPLVEAARQGKIRACTTAGVLCEVYAGLTWVGAQPPHAPQEAAHAIELLVKPPSAIHILPEKGLETLLDILSLATIHRLTARNVHDARHAATALAWGITSVYTYDPADWNRFETSGLRIEGPPSTLLKLRISP